MIHPGVMVAMEYFVLLLSVLVDTDLRNIRLQKYTRRFHKVSCVWVQLKILVFPHSSHNVNDIGAHFSFPNSG